MAVAPIPMRWSGEAFEPLMRFRRLCDQTYTVGEVYRVDAMEERSANSHNHYFASIGEAWKNLSEDASERFPTAEHLRKWALIKAGYRDERNIVCASKAEASRVAAFIKPMDEFAVVTVSEAVVVVYTAKSQSMRAMGKEPFQDSKERVLDILAGMIGVTRDDLPLAAIAPPDPQRDAEVRFAAPGASQSEREAVYAETDIAPEAGAQGAQSAKTPHPDERGLSTGDDQRAREGLRHDPVDQRLLTWASAFNRSLPDYVDAESLKADWAEVTPTVIALAKESEGMAVALKNAVRARISELRK